MQVSQGTVGLSGTVVYDDFSFTLTLATGDDFALMKAVQAITVNGNDYTTADKISKTVLLCPILEDPGTYAFTATVRKIEPVVELNDIVYGGSGGRTQTGLTAIAVYIPSPPSNFYVGKIIDADFTYSDGTKAIYDWAGLGFYIWAPGLATSLEVTSIDTNSVTFAVSTRELSGTTLPDYSAVWSYDNVHADWATSGHSVDFLAEPVPIPETTATSFRWKDNGGGSVGYSGYWRAYDEGFHEIYLADPSDLPYDEAGWLLCDGTQGTFSRQIKYMAGNADVSDVFATEAGGGAGPTIEIILLPSNTLFIGSNPVYIGDHPICVGI